MTIKSGFMLRDIAGQWVVVPLGARVVDFNSILTLSESAAILWRSLEKGAEKSQLVERLLNEYHVSEDKATQDVRKFLDTLQEKGLMD